AILYRLGLGYAVEHDRGLVAALAGGKRGGLTSRSWVHRSAERRGPEGRDGRRVGGVEAGAVDGDAHVAVLSVDISDSGLRVFLPVSVPRLLVAGWPSRSEPHRRTATAARRLRTSSAAWAAMPMPAAMAIAAPKTAAMVVTPIAPSRAPATMTGTPKAMYATR